MNKDSTSIALFGGSFDPIHKGHIKLLETVKSSMPVEEIHLIPCRRSPHKDYTPLASDIDRLNMCELACQSLDYIIVNPIELESNLEEPSYSWKTVHYYQKTYPQAQLYWILGGDQWEKLHLWENYDFLIKSLHFIVLERQAKLTPKADRVYTALPYNNTVSSTQIRKEWELSQESSGITEEVREYMVKNALYTKRVVL